MGTGSAVSAQTLLITIVPTLWASMLRGQPANVCVDSCRVLQCCYAQFGIGSEIRAVDLAVTDDAGRTYMHGTPQPSWEGNVLDGHCILYLPGENRIVDATVEQFREIGRLKHGPLVGKMMVQLTPGRPGSGLPAGAQLPLRRASLTLLYTMASDDATQVILDHQAARENQEGHQRAGINLASAALEFLRRHSQARPLDLSPYPRAAALLAATSQAPAQAGESGDWYYSLTGADGQVRHVRLDQIPLPPDTPLPAGNSPPAPPEEDLTPEPSQRPAGRLRGALRRRRTQAQVTPPQPAAPAGPQLDAAALARGLPIPGGVLLRPARPGDTAEVSRLLAMAGLELPAYLSEAIKDQSAGALLMRALGPGRDEILTALATAAHRGDPNLVMPGLTACLVAENARHRVCGTLLALPPAAVMAQAAAAGIPGEMALFGTAAVVKINGLAVDQASRGMGIGTALISTCLQLYFQLGYQLAYGQFSASSGLETYYRRLGFDVLAPGKSISLSERLIMPIGLTSESGEQFFLRWQ